MTKYTRDRYVSPSVDESAIAPGGRVRACVRVHVRMDVWLNDSSLRSARRWRTVATGVCTRLDSLLSVLCMKETISPNVLL